MKLDTPRDAISHLREISLEHVDLSTTIRDEGFKNTTIRLVSLEIDTKLLVIHLDHCVCHTFAGPIVFCATREVIAILVQESAQIEDTRKLICVGFTHNVHRDANTGQGTSVHFSTAKSQQVVFATLCHRLRVLTWR